MTDPYCYPGTNVLINRYDIRNADSLCELERDFSNARLGSVEKIRGNFDAKHLKAIHKHLFGDVYSWAGEFRTGDIWKDGSSFCPYQDISRRLNGLHAELKVDRYMKGSYSRDAAAERLEHYFSILDKIHPFREGNGRTERVFLGQLADNAGYELDFSGVTQHDWIHASKLCAYGVHDPMQRIFAEALRPVEQKKYELFKRRLPLIQTSSFATEKSDDYECD